MSDSFLTYQQFLPLRLASLFVVFGVLPPCLALLVRAGFGSARQLAFHLVPEQRQNRNNA